MTTPETAAEPNKTVTETNTEVAGPHTDATSLVARVDAGFDRFDSRFDRLEMLLTLPEKEVAAAPKGEIMRTKQEKQISVIEMKLGVYSSKTADNRDELQRHNQMFDAYDERLDALDSQMREVLGILRGKTG